ncbi:MAG TPA: flagellar basal body rod protein FlgB [Rhizomicrobium sp.]|jgi:flagellar basal-body rod protein FlgB
MNLPEMPLLSILRDRMSWLNARQTLLSQNVANADTPGYAARDLKPMDFESALKQSTASNFAGLVTTDANHIAVSTSGPSHIGDAQITEQETTSSGNSVSLEQEMIKVADTQAQYQAAANLYSKMVGMMRTAIGGA